MNKLLFLFCGALLLSACTPRRERIIRIWLFDRVNFTEEKAPEDFTADIVNPMNLSIESFLSLQPDQHYTSYFGYYDEGDWAIKDDNLVLSSTSGIVQRFAIRYVGKERMVLYYPQRTAEYTFKGYAQMTGKDGDNPFAQVNNRWRIKARRPESDAAIRDRIANHLHFWESYFAWAEQNKLATLPVNNMSSPLRIYGNGFELLSYDEEPYEWKNHFYSETDAHKAYDQLHALVKYGHIHWESTDNHFSMFRSAFRQLQHNMTVMMQY